MKAADARPSGGLESSFRSLCPMVVAAVAGAASFGIGQAAPGVRPHLLSGQVWLSSEAVGYLTLADGVSATASANVSVGGWVIDLPRSKASRAGYAVGIDDDRIVRVDSATAQHDVGSVRDPLPPTRSPWRRRPQALFAVDETMHTLRALHHPRWPRSASASACRRAPAKSWHRIAFGSWTRPEGR